MDLLGMHWGSFVATNHVAEEITRPLQRERYEYALRAGHISEEPIADPAEVDIFLRLDDRGRLGVGERSAIAVALNRGYRLAMDDNKAIRRALAEAGLAVLELDIVRTEGIVVELVRHGALTIERADDMLVDWAANHRFKASFSSFRALLSQDAGWT